MLLKLINNIILDLYMKKLTRLNVLISLPLLTLLGTGCNFVELKPEADTVKILTADQVANCNPSGTITTKVLDEVLFIPRDDGAMATELEMLARNEAIKSDANAIVPISEIEDGQRTFKAYICP